MFIIEPNPSTEGSKLLRRVKKFIGHVPPHFELFATLNPKRFEMFLNEIFYLSMHKTIQPDFFALLRFYIASKEHFTYCHAFNKSLLEKKGFDANTLLIFEKDASKLPLDPRHQALFNATIQAIYVPETFTNTEHQALLQMQWSEADIFDALDHGAFLFKFSKILKAYSKASVSS